MNVNKVGQHATQKFAFLAGAQVFIIETLLSNIFFGLHQFSP